MGNKPNLFKRALQLGDSPKPEETIANSIFDTLPIGVAVHNSSGDLTYLNQAARGLLGYYGPLGLSTENLVQTLNLHHCCVGTFYPVGQLPHVLALQGHKICVEDLKTCHSDRPIVLQAKASPIKNSCGEITHAVVFYRMLAIQSSPTVCSQHASSQVAPQFSPSAQASASEADRLSVEQHLSSQHWLRLEACAAAVAGVSYSLLVRRDGSITLEYVSEQIEAFYEAPPTAIAQAPARYVWSQMHPSNRPELKAEFVRCMDSLTNFECQWQSTSPSGQVRYLQAYAQPECRENGDICWHGLLREVSYPTDVPKALEQSISQMQAVLTALPDLIVRVNGEGHYLSHVRNHRQVDALPTHLSPIHRYLTNYLLPTVGQKYLAAIQMVLATGELQSFEQALPIGDRIQYEEVRVVPCGDDEVLLIIRDIRDHKTAEIALQAREAEHHATMAALPDLMFRVSHEGYWLGYINNNQQIDYLPDGYDSQGHHISEHMPAAVAEQQLQRIQAALATGEMQVFEQCLNVEHGIQYEEVRIVPYRQDEVLFIVRDITDRKVTELALKQSEAENRAIVAAIPDLMFRLHRDGTFLTYFKDDTNPDLLDRWENPVGHNIAEYAVNEFYAEHIQTQMQAVHRALHTGQMVIYEQQVPIGDRVQHEEVRIVPSGLDEALVIIQNIDDRKAIEIALRQSEAQKQAILTAIPDLIFYMRQDGVILEYMGGSDFVDILQEQTNSPVGRNLMDYATTDSLKIHIDQKMQTVQRALETREMQIYEQRIDINQESRYEEVRIVPINTGEVLVMIRDITNRKCIEAELRSANERLEKLSRTDTLTTLANRRRLDEHLECEWQRATREQQPLSFILFDLDFFKRFNDTYGHQVGDACLLKVAQATLTIVNRSSDLVARYGGEEFAVVLANTDLKGAFAIAQRIRENILVLKIPHQTSEVHTFVTASLGVSSIIPRPSSLPNVLIRQADQALYSAKQAGRNNCQCFIRR